MNVAELSQMRSAFCENCHQYYVLCKPKVVALMVFTAWVGMFLAAPGNLPWDAFFYGTVGIALMAASAAAVNHVVDRQIDAKMVRTRNRPLATGSLPLHRCVMFAAAMGVSGFALLLFEVNFLTAALTFLSLVGYAFIYTLYLKRATPQNIVIGGAAGATPPLLGWTAITGQIDPYALVLFLIIFTWTPPHFWALAIYRKADYAKVGIPMMPVTHGDDYTRLQIIYYTVLLLLVTILPFLMGVNGVVYLIGALFCGGLFLYHALMMWMIKSSQWAIKTFVFSIVYLLVLFAFLLIDRYLPILLERIPVVF